MLWTSIPVQCLNRNRGGIQDLNVDPEVLNEVSNSDGILFKPCAIHPITVDVAQVLRTSAPAHPVYRVRVPLSPWTMSIYRACMYHLAYAFNCSGVPSLNPTSWADSTAEGQDHGHLVRIREEPSPFFAPNTLRYSEGSTKTLYLLRMMEPH